MRCPTCTTEVPPARFCARCGYQLGDAARPPAASPGATRRFLRRAWDEVSTSGWRLAGMIVLVGAVAGVGASVAPERGVVEDEVALPTGMADQVAGAPGVEPGPASSPFVASPSATVLCSDLSELQVKYAWLDDADVGDTVDVHGSTCIVSAIDLDARPQPYPRGVARGNRPGTGPVPRR